MKQKEEHAALTHYLGQITEKQMQPNDVHFNNNHSSMYI